MSAYPRSAVDLLPEARELAAGLGELPSRNRLKKQLKIGAPKAAELRELLDFPESTETHPAGPGPAESVAESVTEPMTEPSPQVAVDVDPGPAAPRLRAQPVRSWPVFLIALPAAVAIWSGWVGLGGLAGFGVVHPFPGIWDSFALNTAITLPIGVEAYAAYALKAWLAGSRVPVRARRFARWSAVGSLLVGSAGQVAYHLMESAGMTSAPWQITTAVSCLPVAVLGMGAALAHLLHTEEDTP